MARRTTTLPSRTLVQLASPYKPTMNIAGWFLSEKLDGIRTLWDGGATRGIPVVDIPFANVLKHDRIVQAQTATGLWTRYGHPIFAPDWWLDKLPNFPLDGESWIARQHFQQTSSIIRKFKESRNDDDWRRIKYKIFDTPPMSKLWEVGEINETNYVKVIGHDVLGYMLDHSKNKQLRIISPRGFESQQIFLQKYLTCNDVVSLHEQEKLPGSEAAAKLTIKERFDHFVSLNAEGLILRSSIDEWTPIRSKLMVKVKQANDAECKITGYTSAEFGLTGAKLGLVGSLIVDYQGIKFQIGTGLTDEERAFGNTESTRWAKANPGEVAPSHVYSNLFKRGELITFKYSEFTADGVPKEARYYRKAT